MAAGLLALFALPTPLAFAASCSGKSHQISLSAGGATPGSGSTATVFQFAVIYADSAGCAPSSVKVTIVGVGTYAMSRSATGGYVTGVTYTRGMKLPVGIRTYSFSASSGSGKGLKTATYTAVSPARLVVSAPIPSPTPRPTPKPTPKPTVKPTPRPTAKPTVKPKPTASSRASAAAATPLPTRSVAARPSPTPEASRTTQPATAGKPPPSAGAVGATGGRAGGPPFDLLALLAATAAGFIFFLWLAPRRRREPPEPVATPDPEPTPSTPVVRRPLPEFVATAPNVLPEEENVPRWLRPSVRTGRGLEPPRRRNL